MSSAIDCSSAFDLECGEKATLALTSPRPRSVHLAEPVLPKLAGVSLCQKSSNAARNGLTALLPCRTTALLDCTKKPRHVKLVEPHTIVFTFGPSTAIVLLC